MIRAVFDTNVFVSALVFGGKPRIILEMAESGAFELAVSRGIRGELEKILQQKFGWPEDYVVWACQPIWKLSHIVVPKFTVRSPVIPTTIESLNAPWRPGPRLLLRAIPTCSV